MISIKTFNETFELYINRYNLPAIKCFSPRDRYFDMSWGSFQSITLSSWDVRKSKSRCLPHIKFRHVLSNDIFIFEWPKNFSLFNVLMSKYEINRDKDYEVIRECMNIVISKYDLAIIYDLK